MSHAAVREDVEAFSKDWVQLWMVDSSVFEKRRSVEYNVDSDPIGIVEGHQGSSIRLEDWVARIRSDSCLRPPDPAKSNDPLTRQPLTIMPHPGTAYIYQGETRIGMMTWSEEGLDEIVVYGASPRVVAVAEDVAKQLGGRFRRLQ
jgi:hypothetical protein